MDVLKPVGVHLNTARVPVTEKANKSTIQKPDKRVLITLIWVYFLKNLNRTVLGYGARLGLQIEHTPNREPIRTGRIHRPNSLPRLATLLIHTDRQGPAPNADAPARVWPGRRIGMHGGVQQFRRAHHDAVSTGTF
ncbi:hypothetical protein BDW68DRAFT_174719 [Aspergillus falconensis]